jgi:thiamine-phosphate pyrophosphorylase
LLSDDEVAGLKLSLQKIYPITDRNLSGLSHAEQVTRFIAGGATVIQIREKNLSSGEFFADAAAAVKIARAAKIRILINDRVDIALMAAADGVHLGQDDLPAAAARKLLGPDAVIGLSTHSIQQIREALSDGNADYIAFGPIFPTSTKTDHEPLVGLETLSQVRELVGVVPLVAIGGINRKNLASVLRAGAESAAMISEFYRQPVEISSRFRSLLMEAQTNNTILTS